MWYLSSIRWKENPSSQISADSFYLPRGEEDSLTILLTGCAPQEKDALFALVRLDMLGGRIPVILFPPQTALDAQTGYAAGNAELHQRRAVPPIKALSDSFSIPVGWYADGDSQSLIDAVNRIGVAEYELSQSLSYTWRQHFYQSPPNRQLIDGQKFLDILRYPNYRESDLEQCREGAKLIASYINSRFAAVLVKRRGAGQRSSEFGGYQPFLDFESRLPAHDLFVQAQRRSGTSLYLDRRVEQGRIFVPDAFARRQLVRPSPDQKFLFRRHTSDFHTHSYPLIRRKMLVRISRVHLTARFVLGGRFSPTAGFLKQTKISGTIRRWRFGFSRSQ